MRQNPLGPGDTMAVESAPRGVVTLHISALGTDAEVSMQQCCALSGNRLSQRPVLKHGPRSVSCLRVEGFVHLEA